MHAIVLRHRSRTTTKPTLLDILGCQRVGSGRNAAVFAVSKHWVIKLFHQGSVRKLVAKEAELSSLASRAARESDRFMVPACGGIVAFGRRYGLRFERVLSHPLGEIQGMTARRAAEVLAETHLAIHSVDVNALHGNTALPDQFLVMRDAIAKVTASVAPLASAAGRVLDALALDPCVLCHGDFHPLNLLVGSDDVPAVIDWASSDVGSALCDVARTCLLIRFGRVEPASTISEKERNIREETCAAYVRRYLQRCSIPDARQKLCRWLPLVAIARLADPGIGEDERWALLELVSGLIEDMPGNLPPMRASGSSRRKQVSAAG
jgi:hypothetical protein